MSVTDPIKTDAFRERRGLGPEQERFINKHQNFETITENISRVVLNPRPPIIWMVITALGFLGLMVMLMAITWLVLEGTGIWGNNIPVGWAWDIINFVWWIGIGHAGTLISAILLLMRQPWRASINRFAEAMTIFAVMCAGLYPLLHTGRPWCDYWLFPYPNILGMNPADALAARMGRFCGLDLLLDLALVLVLGTCPRHLDPARPCQAPFGKVDVRRGLDGLDRFSAALVSL